MEAANYLIYTPLLLSVGGTAASLLHLRTRDGRLLAISRFSSLAVFLSVTAALVYLYYLFLASEVSVEYVWSYSRTDHPLKYKLAGAVAGPGGSLLLWVWATTVPLLVHELRDLRSGRDSPLLDWTRAFVLCAVGALLYALSFYQLFDPTPGPALSMYPNGLGLAPVLRTDLMIVHPPVVLLAYGFLAFPFAAGLAYLASGDRRWLEIATPWSRCGWLLFTFGIGLGGLWAYTVLGWGGFWGWDPIEASSLLPWIMLTGFLHAQWTQRCKGGYRLLAPAMGVVSYLLVVFAAFATRAEGLWLSVHAFGSANVAIDPGERFVDVVQGNPVVAVLLSFVVAFLALSAALLLYRFRRSAGGAGRRFQLREMPIDDVLMASTVSLSVLVTAVAFAILLAGANGLSGEDFDARVGPLVLASILIMVACMIWRITGRKYIAIMCGSALLTSLMAYTAFPGNRLLALSLPILCLGVVASIVKVARSIDTKRPIASMRLVSANLIHLAVVLIVLGYVASSFMATEEDISLVVDGDGEDVAGYTFSATGIDSDADGTYVEIGIWRDGKLLGTERPGVAVIEGRMRTEIRVHGTLAEDIYLTYHYDNESLQAGIADITVKVIPLMKCVWGGMWLMVAGMAGRGGFGWLLQRRRAAAAGRSGARCSRGESALASSATRAGRRPPTRLP